MQSVNNTRKFVFLSVMTGVSMILSIIEGMIPLPFIAPGARLGLCNIITVSVMVIFGFKSAAVTVVLRCVLMMLVAGNPISFIYSIVSGFFSFVVMYFAYKYLGRFLSLVGISVLGAMAHNAAQILVACVMFDSIGIFMYLPIMSVVSIFTGGFVGYTSFYVTDNLRRVEKFIAPD